MMFQDKQQIVICVLAGFIVGGFMLFRYQPLRKQIKAIEKEKTTQMLAISKEIVESKQLSVLDEQLQKLQRKVGNYEVSIPVQRDLGGFLSRIADLMNEHNLKEQVVAPGKEEQTGELKCIPVNMQCRGKLSQIFGFYKQLQGLGRLLRIEWVELVNDNDFSGEVSMQTKAVVYYRSEAG